MLLCEEDWHCAEVKLLLASEVQAPQEGGYWAARRRDMVMKEAKDQVSFEAESDTPVLWLNCSLMLPLEGRYC